MGKLVLVIYLLFATIFLPIKITAQLTIGQPDIINFYHEQINAGAQNWAVGQDKMGNMYFANNSGLLTYNGKEWKLYPLPNRTIVRALCIAPDTKIYVGGQDALGYFLPDENGRLHYYSLMNKLQANDRKFGDVWNIVYWGDKVFFRTGLKIYGYNYKANEFEVLEAPVSSSWSYMGVCNSRLYAQNEKQGLVYWIGSGWKQARIGIPKNGLVTSIQNVAKDSLLIFTLRQGVYLHTEGGTKKLKLDDHVVNSQIFTSYSMRNGQYAVGTVSNGIYIIDRKGNVIKSYSSDNGLQNSNVLSLFEDRNGVLWTGLDEGIALVNYFSPIQKINGFSKTPIPAYASAILNKKLYIGTSDGVYVSPITTEDKEDITLSRASFTKVPNTYRQVWSLYDFSGTLLMGHHNGAYQIGEAATLISGAHSGCWLFRKVPGISNRLMLGTYDGIQLLLRDGAHLQIHSFSDNNIKEPLRFIEIDSTHQIVWASHPYRGIYKIQMSPNFDRTEKVELLTHINGLPNDLNNFVFKANDQIIFTTENGIYEYDHTRHAFVQSKKYFPIFGNLMIKFLVTDNRGRVWFATEKEVGVVENNKINYIPELSGKLIAGFENIYPYSSNNVLMASYKGIIHFNYNKYKKSYSAIATILNKVVAIGKADSILNNGYYGYTPGKDRMFKLPAAFNSYRFEFSSDRYGADGNVMHHYRLKGYDTEWSGWTSNTTKEYTNLPYGKYTFLVSSKDHLGNVSKTIAYSFEILPKWYQTKLAYFLYIVGIATLFYFALFLHKRRLQKQKTIYVQKQAHLKYVHELELEHNEKEIIKLRNERLESDMMHKNKELATITMHLYKRGRLLGKIKDDLSDAIAKVSQKEEKTDLTKLLKLITHEEKQDNDWEQFAIHFDEVHNKFLHNLKAAYPELTPGDLKLCAYLKMNLSSKDIAQLLHLSLKGVENGRYRLRKKISLASNISLTDFILSFQ